MDVDKMIDILDKYDDNDYDVVKELIPLVYFDSMDEYIKTFHFFDFDKDDLKFLIVDRIFWFLIDYCRWSEGVDIDIINSLVYEYYEK